MSSNRRADDPALGERAWIGYHPRAALPALVAVAAVALVVWTGRWYLEDLSNLADQVGALAVFAMAWCVWPAVAAVYLYRTVTYTYLLTDRAVLVDFGFWHRPVPLVWLQDVTDVRSGAGWLAHLLGVGWVEVGTADRVVRMVGVRHPVAFAERIRVSVRSFAVSSVTGERPA